MRQRSLCEFFSSQLRLDNFKIRSFLVLFYTRYQLKAQKKFHLQDMKSFEHNSMKKLEKNPRNIERNSYKWIYDGKPSEFIRTTLKWRCSIWSEFWRCLSAFLRRFFFGEYEISAVVIHRVFAGFFHNLHMVGFWCHSNVASAKKQDWSCFI